MIVVLMGVSGAGKTTIGSALAARAAWPFLDADDFHPAANVAKMASGTPLTDADRRPWLEILNAELRAREARGDSAVLACSALKAIYREQLLRGLTRPRLVYLDGDFDLIRRRTETRKHRYMPAALLQSQFETLEPPSDALRIDAALSVEQAVQSILQALPARQA